jgi:GTP-binding protein
MKQAVVALVGRPNVGKSALFNRLTGKARAIVDAFSGLTRDRNYGLVTWQNKDFILIDTGGVELETPDKIRRQVQEQTQAALQEADIILYILDARTPLDRADERIAEQLRKTAKPVFLVVNKVDNAEQEAEAQEFWALGLDEPIPVSALHGRRIDELLDAIWKCLPEMPLTPDDADDMTIKMAVVGRPNVGKSSLVNQMLGQPRVLVSEIPGTTRDSVDSDFEYKGKKYRIVDTAGLNAPKHRNTEALEDYAAVRAIRSIKECNVAVLVLDASIPLSEQDERIGGLIHESGRACILGINKWDLLEKDSRTSQNYMAILRKRMPFLDYAPIVTFSAKNGLRVDRVLELAAFVDEQHVMRFKTSLLNTTLKDILKKHPEPTRHGKSLKVHYISQTGVRPPAFALFVNEAKRMHFAYLRHIKNSFRERFGLEGTPLIIMLRGQKEAKERD